MFKRVENHLTRATLTMAILSALLVISAVAAFSAPSKTMGLRGTTTTIYDTYTTPNMDGKGQTTPVDLSIGPVPDGYRLTNVTMTHVDGQNGANWCDWPPKMDVEVRTASAHLTCWSLPVTWTLKGDVIPDSSSIHLKP